MELHSHEVPEIPWSDAVIQSPREAIPIGSPVRPRRFVHGALLAGLTASLCLLAACGGGGPTRACLSLQASPSLNLHDGQANATVVFLYPLRSVTGFDQTPADALLRGEEPPGLAGARVKLTVLPDGITTFQDDFDTTTTHIGILADYYREDDDPAGRRKTRVPARCGWFRRQTVVLSRTEILSP